MSDSDDISFSREEEEEEIVKIHYISNIYILSLRKSIFIFQIY